MLIIGILIFFGLLVIGMPIGFLLGSFGAFTIFTSDFPVGLLVIPQRFFGGLNSFSLMAMPFFMLCGQIMDRSGVSMKLLRFADLLVGRLRGGIGHMNVIASFFFAGLSGSGLADVVGLGSIEIPMMEKAGYDKEYSCAITVSSAILGPIIPPSIIMVIYGATMNVSIAGLFAAGIPTGILLAGALLLTNRQISKKRNYPRRTTPYSKSEVVQILKDTLPIFLLPAIILGGITFGLTTPTEAGAIAVVYSVILGVFYYRSINPKDLLSILMDMIKLSSMVFLLIGATSVLGWWLTMVRIPNKIGSLIMFFSDNPYMIIFLINVLLLIVGMFMDLTAALLILGPVLAPIAINAGFHPLHTGIIISMNLTIAMITPPLGTCLFAGCTVGKIKFESLVKANMPFLIVITICLFVVTYVPAIPMSLPKLLGYY